MAWRGSPILEKFPRRRFFGWVVRSRRVFSPPETAILLVDLQEPLLQSSKTNPPDTLRRSLFALLQMAQAAKIPVLASTISLGGPDPFLLDEIKKHATGLEIFSRGTIGVISQPELKEQLTLLRCKRIILAGLLSEVAVRQTAL